MSLNFENASTSHEERDYFRLTDGDLKERKH